MMQLKASTLTWCVLVATSAIWAEESLMCYKCGEKPTHHLCNQAGVDMCGSDEICFTRLAFEDSFELKITKRCGKASECGFSGLLCDPKGTSCNFCCEGELCNSGYWLPKRGHQSCDNTSCQNGGVCRDNGRTSMCYCPAGYLGQVCEIEANACHLEPCVNDGQCIPQSPGFLCICPKNYGGTTCNVRLNCFTCPDNSTQNYRDPFDCSKFYQCQHGISFHTQCPAGSQFSAQTRACETNQEAHCHVEDPAEAVADHRGCASHRPYNSNVHSRVKVIPNDPASQGQLNPRLRNDLTSQNQLNPNSENDLTSLGHLNSRLGNDLTSQGHLNPRSGNDLTSQGHLNLRLDNDLSPQGRLNPRSDNAKSKRYNVIASHAQLDPRSEKLSINKNGPGENILASDDSKGGIRSTMNKDANNNINLRNVNIPSEEDKTKPVDGQKSDKANRYPAYNYSLENRIRKLIETLKQN